MPYLLEVVLRIPVNKTFFYYSEDEVKVGARVIVKYHNKEKIGVVIRREECNNSLRYRYAHIKEILDKKPLIREWMIEVAEWMAIRYLTYLNKCLSVVFPFGLFFSYDEYLVPVSSQFFLFQDKNIQEVLNKIRELKEVTIKELEHIFPDYNIEKIINYLLSERLIGIVEEYKAKVIEPLPHLLMVNKNRFEESIKNSPEMQKILERYGNGGSFSPYDLMASLKIRIPVIRKLLREGFLIEVREQDKNFTGEGLPRTLEGIVNEVFKTLYQEDEVYVKICLEENKLLVALSIIECFLRERGGPILLIVPEINISEKLFYFFKKKIKNVVCYHSRIYSGRREIIWEDILSNKNLRDTLIIGSRSAIFLPFEELPLVIVMDEGHYAYTEHKREPTWDLISTLRKIRSFLDFKMLFLSAFPSVRLYKDIKERKIKVIEHKDRDTFRPLIKVVKRENPNFLGAETVSIIKEYLKKGKKVLIIHSQKGYGKMLMCNECEEIIKCIYCENPLIYLKKEDMLMCGNCLATYEPPYKCPYCEKNAITFLKPGIEKIEAILQSIIQNLKDCVLVNLDKVKNLDSLSLCSKAKVYISSKIFFHLEDKVDLIVFSSLENLFQSFEHVTDELVFQRMMTIIEEHTNKGKYPFVIIDTSGRLKYSLLDYFIFSKYEDYILELLKVRAITGLPPFNVLIRIEISENSKESLNKSLKVLQKKLEEIKDKILMDISLPRVMLTKKRKVLAAIYLKEKKDITKEVFTFLIKVFEDIRLRYLSPSGKLFVKVYEK